MPNPTNTPAAVKGPSIITVTGNASANASVNKAMAATRGTSSAAETTITVVIALSSERRISFLPGAFSHDTDSYGTDKP